MPELGDISYSQEATVNAVRDYYHFLTKLYLNESEIIEPPPGGWPNLRTNLKGLNKSEEVYSLLSRLPYIRGSPDGQDGTTAGPRAYFADWPQLGQSIRDGSITGDEVKWASERINFGVPAHVIGLTFGPLHNQVFLLDIKHGVVHWHGCYEDIKETAAQEMIEDYPYDYAATEDEAIWIEDSGSWAVADFFEMLKDQFRELNFVPMSEKLVTDIYESALRPRDEVIDLIQEICAERGWPNLDEYNKVDCLEAIEDGLRLEYPEFLGKLPDLCTGYTKT